MKRALVLSLICALGLGFSGLAATLTGYWDTEVIIDPTVVSFADAISIDSELGVTYAVGDWAFTSITNITDAGWDGQEFTASGVLGAFSISSDLVFDPANALFTSWTTMVSVSIAGVSFGAEFTLADNDTTLVLSGSGVAGDVSVGVEVTFGGDDNDICDLDWAGIVIDLGFPFCCADIAAELEFTCDGFDHICFSTSGIAVPNMPYLTLTAEVCFTMEEKTLSLTPSFDFGDIACFDIEFDADWEDLSIQNITITGIGLTCDIGAVTFSGWSQLDGSEDYWEWYTIETNDDACCGPFGFDLSIYFLEGGIRLFDIALIEANMELQVAAQFQFNMGITVDVELGAFTEWVIGFLVTW